MTLVSKVAAVLAAIDFPAESLPSAWAARAPKVVLALGRVSPTGGLQNAIGWGDAGARTFGSRELIDILNRDWDEQISRGSYDEVRRRCVKFLVEAGVALKDPDDPGRAPNSPRTGYSLSPLFARLLRAFEQADWDNQLAVFQAEVGSLRERIRQERAMQVVRVTFADGETIDLSPGDHNELQAAIVHDFLSRYAPGCEIIYIADALARTLYKNDALLREAGFFELDHRQLPDVIALDRKNGWIVIVEAVASSGHLSPLRMIELKRLLVDCKFPQVFVSAFPNYAVFGKFSSDLAWETEAWIADHPTHLIHFDGKRYLGPYT